MEKLYTRDALAESAHSVMAKGKLSAIYATEDGQLFYDENRAKLHATSNGLQVFSFKNNDKETTRLEKIQELNTLELIPSNYHQMKKLANYFGLETPNEKAASFIEILTKFKQEMQE